MKTAVLAIFIRVPVPGVSQYINPISQRNRDEWRWRNGHIS